MSLVKYKFARDNDGHTFLIPADEADDFDELLEAAGEWDGSNEAAEDEFLTRFEPRRISGSPYSWTFSDPQRDGR